MVHTRLWYTTKISILLFPGHDVYSTSIARQICCHSVVTMPLQGEKISSNGRREENKGSLELWPILGLSVIFNNNRQCRCLPSIRVIAFYNKQQNRLDRPARDCSFTPPLTNLAPLWDATIPHMSKQLSTLSNQQHNLPLVFSSIHYCQVPTRYQYSWWNNRINVPNTCSFLPNFS